MLDCNTHYSHLIQKPLSWDLSNPLSVLDKVPFIFLGGFCSAASVISTFPLLWLWTTLRQLEFILYQMNLIHEMQSPAEVLELILGGGVY